MGLAVAACGLGCAKASSPGGLASASASATPAAAARKVVTRELSSPSAFDLFAAPDGLRLSWATASPSAGWLKEVELGHDGAPRAPAHSLPLPARVLGKVTDLSTTPLEGRLAVAWLEQKKGEARASASVVGTTGAPALIDLGAAAITAESARGNLALVAEPERQRALVLWRGLAAPCVTAQPEACVGFTFRRLRPDGAEPSDMPLSVPVPCASHSVQLLSSPGRFHYGICAREGNEPVTTMFSIQYEPPYARAEPLLKGCLPLGSLLVSGSPWLIADCHGRRRAVPVPRADERVEPEPIDALRISCTPERAELRQGRFALALREPRAGLEALLPSSWLPAGARAGWTGKSVVVAYESAGQLETRVFGCERGTLVPR